MSGRGDFLDPIGPYVMNEPYGSYIWESKLPAVEQLRRWVTFGVFPETHRRLKALGWCDNYRLTDLGRRAMEQPS